MSLERYHMRTNTVIRASAGTGKTYTLIETMTHLLAGASHHSGPVKPRELVAITFTEKAAGEMLERVRRRVDELAEGVSGADATLRESASLLGRSAPRPDQWAEVRRSIDQLRITTFHSFCLSLLRRYPLEAGLDPTFGVYDEEGLSGRLDELAELTVLGALEDDSLRGDVERLVSSIRLSSDFKYAPGLSQQLPELLRQIHESGLEVDDATAASAGLAGPTERRLAQAVGQLLTRLETRFADEKRRAARVDFGDMQRLARNLLRDRPDIRNELKQQIQVMLVDEYQDTNPVQRDLVLMLGETPQRDVDWRTRRPGAVVPEGYELGRRRLFVVGDPKQSIYDFRGADVSTFHQTEGLVRRAGGLVDALQVSYRSRPGLVAALNDVFAEALKERDGEQATWFVHWTDDAALSAHRPEILGGPAIHLVDSQAHCTAQALEAGRARRMDQSVELEAVAELVQRGIEGPNPWMVVDADGLARPARYGDVTLLLRRFVNILSPLTGALERRAIPYYVIKGRGFFAAPEVGDLSVALTALSAGHDDLALAAFLRGPLIGVSDVALARLAMRHGRLSAAILERVGRGREPLDRVSPADRRALQSAARLLADFGRRGEAIGAARTIDLLLERTLWPAVLAALPRGDQALANIERVRRLAAHYRGQTGAGLAGFARSLAQLVDREPAQEPAQVVEEHDDVVRIMTIHQAKGLECRIAVVPDADPSRPPYPPKLLFSPRHGLGVGVREDGESEADTPCWVACKQERQSRHLAELRRLMYVAFTRARDHVVVSGSTPLKKREHQGSTHFVRAEPSADEPHWMHVVQSFKGEPPAWLDIIPLETLVDPTHPSRPADPTTRPPAEPPPPELRSVIERVLAPPPPPRGQLVSAVTQLSDFAACPRRYWFLWEMGLQTHLATPTLPDFSDPADEELPQSERGDGPVVWPIDPLDRGTLAHALLEHLDAAELVGMPLPRRTARLTALGARLGSPVPHPARDEVVEHVARLLDGEIGRWLATETGIERELPFVLHVPLRPPQSATHLFLRGQVDLVVPARGDRPALIIDYKVSDLGAHLGRYAFQLQCYALAHHRRVGSPDGGLYRLGIVFLRAAEPRVTWLGDSLRTLGSSDLERFSDRLGELGSHLLSARHENRWPRVDPEQRETICRALGCRFETTCFADQ